MFNSFGVVVIITGIEPQVQPAVTHVKVFQTFREVYYKGGSGVVRGGVGFAGMSC